MTPTSRKAQALILFRLHYASETATFFTFLPRSLQFAMTPTSRSIMIIVTIAAVAVPPFLVAVWPYQAELGPVMTNMDADDSIMLQKKVAVSTMKSAVAVAEAAEVAATESASGAAEVAVAEEAGAVADGAATESASVAAEEAVAEEAVAVADGAATESASVAALAVPVAGSRISTKRQRLTLDNNQKVYIENQPVLGDGAGDGALGECRSLASFVANPDAPAVKVCGTNIKATFYLRPRCQGYYEHSKTLGQCDTGLPPDTCESWSPADDPRFGHYTSYMIDPC